jgi:hypothetical protein
MFGHDPQYLQSLNDIAAVSQRMSQMSKRYERVDHGVAGVAVLEGLWHEPLTTMGLLTGGYVAGKILTRPVTAQSMAGLSRAALAYRLAPSPATQRLLGNASRRMSGAIASQFGMQVGAPDILHSFINPAYAQGQVTSSQSP